MYNKTRIIDRCQQILESIDYIIQWSKEIITPEDFLLSPNNVLVFDGCIMRLQVIGENVKKIDEQTEGLLFQHYQTIPWKKIIGLRNIISHEYSNVDEEIIFAIIKQSIPPLRSNMIDIIKALQDETF